MPASTIFILKVTTNLSTGHNKCWTKKQQEGKLGITYTILTIILTLLYLLIKILLIK